MTALFYESGHNLFLNEYTKIVETVQQNLPKINLGLCNMIKSIDQDFESVKKILHNENSVIGIIKNKKSIWIVQIDNYDINEFYYAEDLFRLRDVYNIYCGQEKDSSDSNSDEDSSDSNSDSTELEQDSDEDSSVLKDSTQEDFSTEEIHEELERFENYCNNNINHDINIVFYCPICTSDSTIKEKLN